MNSDSLKEKELLALIAGDNEAAFKTLFDLYRNRIYGSAFKLSHSAVIAEEIVQNVFLKVWQHRSKLPGVDHFKSYLYVITRNEIYAVLNRIARDYKALSQWHREQDIAENDTEKRVLEREYRDLLNRAIERLPLQQKKVYTLMKVQGLKREETAHLLRVHPETVKSHLALAVKSVRKYCLLHLHQLFGGFLYGIFLFS
ncbi:MAG: sigma-70 family RNA polymerase sigma factor [Chitinophagaceae bacterium]|nr:sigma-70 family RNA polymerase sigma factor [Chitinophagaceae bacterium]